MIILENPLLFFVLSTLIPANINVDGFGEIDAKKKTTEDVAKETFGSLTRTNSICGHETCLSLCCAVGEAMTYGSCLKDNVTVGTLPGNIDAESYQFFRNNPCSLGWLSFSVFDHFHVLHDGSISDGESVFHSERYCLFRNPESPKYSARVCHTWTKLMYWGIAGLIFASVMLLMTIISYSIVPELKNLHGSVFRAYLTAYIASHLSFAVLQVTNGSKVYVHLFTISAFILHYFAECCALWSNVMIFNIWRTFRDLRQIDISVRERQRTKFIWYAIYACGIPAVVNLTVLMVVSYVPYFQKFGFVQGLVVWTCASLLTCIAIVNTFFYASTALKIREYKKETANFTSRVNKHHDEDEQWCNLNVRLFFITGVHTITWVVCELWSSTIINSIVALSELIQSILIFFIFVWKDNVKRSIRKRFHDFWDRLRKTSRIDDSVTL